MKGDLCYWKLSIANKQESNRVYGCLSESYDHIMTRAMLLSTTLATFEDIWSRKKSENKFALIQINTSGDGISKLKWK